METFLTSEKYACSLAYIIVAYNQHCSHHLEQPGQASTRTMVLIQHKRQLKHRWRHCSLVGNPVKMTSSFEITTSIIIVFVIVAIWKKRLFCHIARVPDAVPAKATMSTACGVRDGRRPSTSWKKPRGWPSTTWLHQVTAATAASMPQMPFD